MATCPDCGGVIDVMATNCEHCGFTYPERIPSPKSKLLRGRLADLVLLGGTLVAGAVAVLFIGIGGAALAKGDAFTLLVLAPAGFLGNLALVIVFLRSTEN